MLDPILSWSLAGTDGPPTMDYSLLINRHAMISALLIQALPQSVNVIDCSWAETLAGAHDFWQSWAGREIHKLAWHLQNLQILPRPARDSQSRRRRSWCAGQSPSPGYDPPTQLFGFVHLNTQMLKAAVFRLNKTRPLSLLLAGLIVCLALLLSATGAQGSDATTSPPAQSNASAPTR